MNKRKTLILYLFIFHLALIGFLYLLFPEERVNRHLSNTFGQWLPDHSLNIGSSRPSLPVALRLSDVSVNRTGEEVFRSRSLKIGRPVLSFFTPGQSYQIKAKAYGGIIDGTVTTMEENSGTHISTDVRLSQIGIGDLPLMAHYFNDGVAATLSGRMTYDNIQSPGRGTITLNLADVSMPISISAVKLGDIHFTDITIEGTINQQDLSITKCEAKGNQASAQLSGVIVIKTPADNSLLSLSGTFEPHHELLKNIPMNIFPVNQMGSQGLPFMISGTFKKPVFSFR